YRDDGDPVEIDFRVLRARHEEIGHDAQYQHHDEGDIGQRVVVQQTVQETHCGSLYFPACPAGSAKRPSSMMRVVGAHSSGTGRPTCADGSTRNWGLPSCSTQT